MEWSEWIQCYVETPEQNRHKNIQYLPRETIGTTQSQSKDWTDLIRLDSTVLEQSCLLLWKPIFLARFQSSFDSVPFFCPVSWSPHLALRIYINACQLIVFCKCKFFFSPNTTLFPSSCSSFFFQDTSSEDWIHAESTNISEALGKRLSAFSFVRWMNSQSVLEFYS